MFTGKTIGMEDRDAKVIKLLRDGLTYEEAAEKLGISVKALQHVAERLGVKADPWIPVNLMEVAEEILKKGGTDEEAAHAIGRGVSAIHQCIRGANSSVGTWHKLIIHEMWDNGVREVGPIAKATGLPSKIVASYLQRNLRTDPELSMEEVIDRIRVMAPDTYTVLVSQA